MICPENVSSDTEGRTDFLDKETFLRTECPPRRLAGMGPGVGRNKLVLGLLLWLVLLSGGCAKYNTFYNAEKAFNEAEKSREARIKNNDEEFNTPTNAQKQQYEEAIRKAQKILDEYPGHSLTDDALFLQAKASHRIQSYRMSVRKIDLLFTNFPQTPYMEEALFTQALNYLLIGDVNRSNEYLVQLEAGFPNSRFQAETFKVQGENSYVIEDWEVARDAFLNYLERFPEAEARGEIQLKLSQCYWELEDYSPAAELLPDLIATAESNELVFRARLQQARVAVKQEEFALADQLVAELRDDAEIFEMQGNVTLVEAESLVAQERLDDAATVLENMPAEWATTNVRALSQDLLGYIYLDRWQLEEARTAFQEAVRGNRILEDLDRSRMLQGTLGEYLAAEQQLTTASGKREAELKLLQANALLFSLGQPRLALDLFLEIAMVRVPDESDVSSDPVDEGSDDNPDADTDENVDENPAEGENISAIALSDTTSGIDINGIAAADSTGLVVAPGAETPEIVPGEVATEAVEIDSALVARALYGAVLVCRDRLALPDSAAIFEDILLTQYPEFPQAFALQSGGRGNLLAYLLERRDQENQLRMLAMASGDSTQQDVNDEFALLTPDTESSQLDRPGRVFVDERRRKVYLQRRDNIYFNTLVSARGGDSGASPDSTYSGGNR